MEGQDVTSTESSSSSNSIWLTNLTVTSANRSLHDAPSQAFPTRAVTLAVVLGSVILVTIIGNILVCVAVFLVKKLRKPCNYLLVSLAVSDLCVAMLVEPIAMLYEIKGSWSFGPAICEIWVSFDVLSCTASILNLCMISVDRYYAISKPLDYGVKRTTRRMILYVAVVWLGAACISLPPLLLLGNEYGIDDKTGKLRCLVCQNFFYQIYATLFSFYIPLFIMIMVYYKIFCAARKIVLEEKRAQSHLEAYCHLDLDQQLSAPTNRQKQPPEFEIHATRGPSPVGHHRNSSASTTCSSKCFTGGPRKSNESQCPMLQVYSAEKQPILPHQDRQQASQTSTTPPPGPHQLLLRDCRLPPGSRYRRQAPNTGSTSSDSPHKQKRLRLQLAKERKASTTLGIIMSAFTVCWLPFFVLTVVRICLKDPDAIPGSLSSVFLWLGYCNSLLNPVIYATLNRDFRKPFREILYFRCGNLQHMMREEFYQSQYGDPVNNYLARPNSESMGPGTAVVTPGAVHVHSGPAQHRHKPLDDDAASCVTAYPSADYVDDEDEQIEEEEEEVPGLASPPPLQTDPPSESFL
ncbi:5-hydroxytryptamine receptor 1-like [Copidosoma floridanum]|uniref:5-hydroxytryptamine receptor 1-like n=1 Tax=Copidosoma floridanum TaxID=29053 RepID=UPI0006C95602|nr:5-hydroxytryptamine receptor 1-like [Copidosoma floridanum]